LSEFFLVGLNGGFLLENSMSKPRLFIASSTESISIAEATNINLDHDFEVSLWTTGTFRLSSNSIDDLLTKSSSVDFSLFIFTPDDIATIREADKKIVRDNVLFELGLFIGAIGKERSFILKPRGVDLHLPTDLLGLTTADYEAERSDNDLISATNKACAQIKSEAKRLGKINHIQANTKNKLQANPHKYYVDNASLKFLNACLKSHTESPGGLSFSYISSSIRGIDDESLRISAIKLERMGLIEKTIEREEQYGNTFYCYGITNDGIDTLLNQSETEHQKYIASFDEDVPNF
jgi:hypothetical protein